MKNEELKVKNEEETENRFLFIILNSSFLIFHFLRGFPLDSRLHRG